MERVSCLLSQVSSLDQAANALLFVSLLILGVLALCLLFGGWLLVRGLRQKKTGSVIFGALVLSVPLIYSFAWWSIRSSAATDAAAEAAKAAQSHTP